MVDLCLYVLLPFNIFHAFLVQPHHDVWGPVVITILLSVLYNVISVASAFLLYKKTDEEKKKPLRYGTIVSNGGFLGNPVIESIYGTSGLLYACLLYTSGSKYEPRRCPDVCSGRNGQSSENHRRKQEAEADKT